MTTQDWTRMLKSFRTKTYRNLPTVDDHKAGSAGSLLNDTRSSSVGLCDDDNNDDVQDVDDGLCRKLFPSPLSQPKLLVWVLPFEKIKAESNFDPALCVIVR